MKGVQKRRMTLSDLPTVRSRNSESQSRLSPTKPLEIAEPSSNALAISPNTAVFEHFHGNKKIRRSSSERSTLIDLQETTSSNIKPVGVSGLTMEELLATKPKSSNPILDVITERANSIPASEQLLSSSRILMQAVPLCVIETLVKEMNTELRQIFDGSIHCKGHELFKKGGLEKRGLSMDIPFGLFTDEQEDVVASSLVDMFCLPAKNNKYFDYTMKVLFPETIMRLVDKVKELDGDDMLKSKSVAFPK